MKAIERLIALANEQIGIKDQQSRQKEEKKEQRTFAHAPPMAMLLNDIAPLPLFDPYKVTKIQVYFSRLLLFCQGVFEKFSTRYSGFCHF